jgi:hypothetical protein
MARDFGSGVPLPPRCEPGVYPVVRAQLGDPLDVVIVDEGWVGYWTHGLLDSDGAWNHTVLCPGRGRCGYCAACVPQRWAGFVGAINQRGLRLVVVSLTRETVASMMRMLGSDESLRKTRWLLTRTGNCPNGLIRVDRLANRGGHLREQPIDVERSLQRLWRLDAEPHTLVGGPSYGEGV